MALKPLQDVVQYTTDRFMNETATAGVIVVSATGVAGSGQAMDSFSQLVTVAANPSGRFPAGVLLNNVVNKDLTQTSLSPLNGETQIGSKVTIARKGVLVTNALAAGSATGILPGQPAYLGPTGTFSNTQLNSGYPRVGTFDSRIDQDGYAKVQIDV